MGFERIANWQVYDDTGRRKYLNQAERQRFLRAADALDSEERALCYLLVYAGCRISEALNLHSYHLDAELLAVKICTLKRRKPAVRSVPVPADLFVMLSALPQGPERLWTMHRATAWRLVKRMMEKAAIAGPMACCKGLRHGFGMHAARSKIPGNLIQRWMGHTSGATTAVYVDAVGCEERQFAARMWS